MRYRFFDFEVFPNWWLCVLGDYPGDDKELTEKEKDNFMMVTSDMNDCRDLLMNLLYEKDTILFGYNIKGYDLIIANAIRNGLEPREVKIINDLIINPGCAWDTKDHIRLAPFAKKKLRNIIYQDIFDDVGGGSLKDKESILGLSIQESTVSFDKEDLTDEDKQETIFYCKHDVYSTMQLYRKVIKPYVTSKLLVGKTFNLPLSQVYPCTNARLVGTVLGATRRHFDDTERVDIELPEKIKQYCYDNLDNKVLEKIRNSTEQFEVKLFDNIVSFGNGGIHSVYDNNLYVESDEEYTLINVDAASYYPSMLIQFDCLSRACAHKELFKKIYYDRLEIKHKPNKTQEEQDIQLAYKLILNTTYGASGNKWLDTYDPYMSTRCCRLGQIFLAALATKLTKEVPTLKIVQTNTDGILAYVKRDYVPKVIELQNEWTKVSDIGMELDYVEKIWQRDVNNYVLVKEGGKIKRKGLWLLDTWDKPGYISISPLTAYACSKAIIQYYTKGKDIVESLVENDSLSDFVFTCKKGPTYRGVVQRYADGTQKELFKCNRVYASKDTSLGMIYKYKMYKGNISYAKIPNIPEHCRLINNDLDTYKFEDIKKDLDYMFYINRCAELMDIRWRQLAGDEIFEIHSFDYFD